MRFIYKFENKKGMLPYKYDTGKIYKIVSDCTDKVYIGSTIRSLGVRFTEHKYNNTTHSKSILQYGQCRIELIEDYPCLNAEQLRRREGYYILNTPNCINKNIAGRTKKESARHDYITHIEQIKIKKKIYNQKNREYIKKRKTERILCDCGIYYTRDNKKRHERTNRHINNLLLN